MAAKGIAFLVALLASHIPIRAVEFNINTGAYVNTPPDDTASGYSVAGWDSGWNAPNVTGWDYVGQVNGASGVYLGNGWVLTAGHVGPGDFTLGGMTYDEVAGSAQSIGTADLSLFEISTSPDLPSLTLALDTPTPIGGASAGSSVVMIGYGGGDGETWGENNVTKIDQSVSVDSFTSTDFYTKNGTHYYSGGSITNTAELVAGDSGGGDFIFNSTTGLWELAGINEAELVNEQTNQVVGSAMVQLSTYDSTIEAIIAPEPSTWALLLGGAGLLAIRTRRRKVEQGRTGGI